MPRFVSGREPRPYSVKDGRFEIEGGAQRFNRPLYGALAADGQHRFRIIAGDKPELVLYLPGIGGYCFFGFDCPRGFAWAGDFAECRSSFGDGEMRYELADPRAGGAAFSLSILPLADSPGLALRARAAGGPPGLGFRLLFGAMSGEAEARAFDAGYHGEAALAFDPLRCRGDEHSIGESSFIVSSAATGHRARGRGEGRGKGSWRFRKVAALGAGSGPAPSGFRSGEMGLLEASWSFEDEGREAYFVLEAEPRDAAEPLGEDRPSPEALHKTALAHYSGLARKSACATPEPLLDAALSAACLALEGAWVAGTYRHGAWSWDLPLLGWRNRYGPIALGEHERVRGEARFFFGMQKGAAPGSDAGSSAMAHSSPRAGVGHAEGYFTERDLAPAAGEPLGRPDPDPAFRGARQSPRSLVVSEGMIPYMPGREGVVLYDMQEVFFDQAIREREWSGDDSLDPALERALGLHLAWEARCFDGDGDGLYENFANYWASDGVFASGGGCSIATAYNYRASIAMAAIVERGGGDGGRWRDQARRIRAAFESGLWMAEEGHPAESVDALGSGLAHPMMSLPSAVHCAESGILDGFQLYQTMRRVETGLEQVEVEGGRLVWNTGWVPYRWSVRDIAYADVFHASLASFLAGRKDLGWAYLMGALRDSTCASVSPGAFMCVREGKSVDFSDSSSMFVRALVEGLYGIRPGFEEIVIAPSFPDSWTEASLSTRDFLYEYSRDGSTERLVFESRRPARMRFRLGARSCGGATVLLDGAPAEPSVAEGIGRTYVEVLAGECGRAELEIRWEGPGFAARPIAARAIPGEALSLESGTRRWTKVYDPQGVLEDGCLSSFGLEARVRGSPGNHSFFLMAQEGKLSYWEPVDLEILEPARRAHKGAAAHGIIMARAMPIDLGPIRNARIADIFRREYRSPRSRYCSLQPPWNLYPPNWSVVDGEDSEEMDDSLLAASAIGGILWSQGIPFSVADPEAEFNAAFVSLWDLHPRRLEIALPIPEGAHPLRLHLLMTGYTHQMLCGVRHGRIEVAYEDGFSDGAELVAPFNFRSIVDGPDTERAEDRSCYGPEPLPAVAIGTKGGTGSRKGRKDGLWARVLSLELRDARPLSLSMSAFANEAIMGLISATVELGGG